MFVHQRPSIHKWQLGEKQRRISKHSSLLSFVPPVGSGCPPQMIELIHNYEHFASSIYLLCPGEQSITAPLVFSKHHECLMEGNLLPTSNHPPNPYTCNTALIFCCFNKTISSSRLSEENSSAVIQLAFEKVIHSLPKCRFRFSSLIMVIYNHHLYLGMFISCDAWLDQSLIIKSHGNILCLFKHNCSDF